MLEELPKWIERAQSGDAEAFELLCARLRPDLVKYASTRIWTDSKRWTEPDDVVQRVFLELREKLATLRPQISEDELRGWLCRRADWRIANVARDHRRINGETALPEPAGVPAGDRTDGTVTREDTRRLIRELVVRLPAEYADVVRLCALEGQTYVEAGRTLGLSEDAVRKRYERAREVLALRLSSLRDD